MLKDTNAVVSLTADESAVVDFLRESYLDFTTTSSRSELSRYYDLAKLASDSRISYIGIISGDIDSRVFVPSDTGTTWLVLGVPNVVINYNDDEYIIGDFLVYLRRKYNDGTNDPIFLVENITPANSKDGGPRLRKNMSNPVHNTYAAHPHAYNDGISGFCLLDVSTEIKMTLVRADIPRVFEVIYSALTTYNQLSPTCEISAWK